MALGGADQRATMSPVLGRPPLVTRESIAKAALRVGLDKLSITAVAAELGVAHPTLYRHVRGRDDLITAAVDLLLRDIERPLPSTGWRDYLRRTGIAVLDVAVSTPGIVEAMRRIPTAPSAMITWFGDVAAALIGLGFDDADAVLATDLVFDMMIDSAATGWLSDTGRADLASLAQSWAQSMPSQVPQATLAASVADPTAWVHRKLDIVLDGIAVALAPTDSSPLS